MPRPTEIIQAEESTAPRSPLRRSCRMIAVSSPMPSEANTIKESTEGKEVEQTGTANRGKRGSSVTKDNGEASIEPGKTRSRRSSTSSESSMKTENKETVKPIRTRRSSATREEETKKPIRGRRSSVQSDIEEEVAKPVKSRRNSIQNEKEEEEESSVKPIRGRRSSAQDDGNEEQRPARITRSRTSMSRDTGEETKDAAEPEPKRTTRSRRSSIDAEDDTVPKPVKTPMKPKRRLSVSETAAVLEPIDEKEEAQNTAKRKDQTVPGSSEIKINTDKTKQLYIICETSLGDEDGRKSLTPKASPSLSDEGKSTKGKLEKGELKGSPVIVPEGGRLTPDSLTVRKSPRIQEKLEKCRSGEHTPHKKCTCCDEELSNSPSRRKIDLKTPEEKDLTCNTNVEDIQFSTKVIHNDKSIQMKECIVDDDVFTSETVVIQKTETKCLINDGSDGSFQFNLSKSKYETTESEGDLNDSKASDSSDKENAHLNLEKNSKPPITAEQNVLEKLAASAKPERVQNITLNRVSNVFRPKNVDYSFVEAMDVDTTLNLDVSRMEKSHIIPNENSKTIDLTVDETFSLNLSDTYIENSEDTTISKGSKTIENSLEDETNEKENTTLNISKENHENEINTKEVEESAQEISSLDVDKLKLKSLKESHKENGVDLKTDSLLNKTDCKDAENREDITENENEVIIEESQIDSLQNITENHHDVETISNIVDRSTDDKAVAEEIEEEDDRFSETDEREVSRKSKDCQSIEVKEEEEDDRFTETKDISEDYEFDVSGTEEVSPVIPTQSECLTSETVKEDILNVSRDEEQSSEIIQREDDQEIDVETLEEDEELSKEIKNNEATMNINYGDQPTKDSHEKLTESAKVSITTDDLEKESVTSSVDDKLACSRRSNDSINTEENAIQTDQEKNIREDHMTITDAYDCKEENNKITEDSDKYDDMENTFQDIVQDDKDEELSATATNTQDLSNNQDKAEETDSDTIDPQKKETSQSVITDNKKENSPDATQLIHDQKETISSESTSSSSLSDLENEERNELPEKMGMSEVLNPVKTQEESNNTQWSVVNSTSLELEPLESVKISAAISPKKGKKKKSGIVALEITEEKEKIDVRPALNSKTNEENNAKINKRFSLDHWFESSTVDDPPEPEDIRTKPKDSKNKKKQHDINLDESPKDNKRDTEPTKVVKKNEAGKKLNSKQFLEQYEDPRLDAELEKLLKEAEDSKSDGDSNSDEDSDSDGDYEEESGNSFLDDMAEEGEEDIPSEDSNAIIDDGEPINTDSERSEDEDYDDDSSFICDEGNTELLSGDEFDLGNEQKKRKSRIINVDDRDEEVIKIKRKIKPEPIKRKSRIIKMEDSSEDEEVVDLVSDQEGSVNPTSEESDQASPKKDTIQETVKPKSSIRIIENVDVREIRDTTLSERINQLVDTFCTTIPQTGDVSMNLSLEYAGKASPEEKKKSKRRKSKDFQIRSISEEENLSKTPKLAEEVSLAESLVTNVSTQPRLSLSMTEDDPSTSEKSLKRRLSNQTGDVSMNLSLEYAGKASPEEKKKRSKKRKSKDFQIRSISEGENLPKTPKLAEEVSLAESLKHVPTQQRLSLSMTEDDPSTSEKSLKRRLSNQTGDVSMNLSLEYEGKASPKEKKKRSKKRKSKDFQIRSISEEENLPKTPKLAEEVSLAESLKHVPTQQRLSLSMIEDDPSRSEKSLKKRLSNQTGDVSMNLSLEYAGKASPEEKKKRSKKRKSKDFQIRSISEEENLPKTSKLPEEVSLVESLKHVPTQQRLSLSMTEDDPSTSEKSLKRRLSKSMDDAEKEVKKRKKKKSKKSRQKAELYYKKSSAKSNSVKDINLDALSFGLLNGLLTDVKNRPRRMIKPSTSQRFDLDNNWTVELGVDAKPSTSEFSKKETEEFKKPKIHPKDFRTQMLYNSSRVKRIETKQLLKKRAYF